MKKRIILILLLTCAIVLSACTSSKLSDIYNEDEVIARAKETVETINTLDYEAMILEAREDLQPQFTIEILKEAWDEKLTGAGEFKEYKSIVVFGQQSETTGEDYAVVISTSVYENDTLVFTISLDVNLDVVGMYMK